jgi:hypothetical protein
MYFDENWVTKCPRCYAEGEITRRSNDSFTVKSQYISFCRDSEGRYIDPNTLEERKVLHCWGCSHLWNFADPRDDWYTSFRSPSDDLHEAPLRPPPLDEEVAGQTYLILNTTSRCYKIGWTTGSVSKRFSALQTASPDELRVVASFPASSSYAEHRLHDIFLLQRIRGEWFNLSDQDVANILNADWRKRCQIY